MGKGCLTAVKNINDTIGPKLIGLDPTKQADIDKMMVHSERVQKCGNYMKLYVIIAIKNK